MYVCIYVCMYVCTVITYTRLDINRVWLPILLVRSCLKILSRATGLTVLSRVSPLVLHTQAELIIRPYTIGLRPPRLLPGRGGLGSDLGSCGPKVGDRNRYVKTLRLGVPGMPDHNTRHRQQSLL